MISPFDINIFFPLTQGLGIWDDSTLEAKLTMTIGCFRAAKSFSIKADGPDDEENAKNDYSIKRQILRSQTQSTSALQQGTFFLSLLSKKQQAFVIAEVTSWEPQTKKKNFEQELLELSLLIQSLPDDEDEQQQQQRQRQQQQQQSSAEFNAWGAFVSIIWTVMGIIFFTTRR